MGEVQEPFPQRLGNPRFNMSLSVRAMIEGRRASMKPESEEMGGAQGSQVEGRVRGLWGGSLA